MAPNVGLYAASKGAVEGFTRSLALELAPRNIRINVISPGAIDTPMFTKMGLTEEQQKMVADHHIASIPLKRFGAPAEVAEAVLAQIECSYVTGSIWTVDGGVDA
ncbi:MAG TPA: SDR family oxidoreductase [Sedimenticola sp.]|nr:SDR family oxidoreductase [Sedimenticola sp.]